MMRRTAVTFRACGVEGAHCGFAPISGTESTCAVSEAAREVKSPYAALQGRTAAPAVPREAPKPIMLNTENVHYQGRSVHDSSIDDAAAAGGGAAAGNK